MEKKRQLTLVGFMVIILIAGIFVALLIPTRERVRESAKRAACKGNLCQIGIAMHLYADENDNAFPTVDPVSMNASPTHTVQAFALLYPNYTDNVRIFSCASSPAHNGGADFAPGGTLQEDSTSYAYDCRHNSSRAGPVIIAGDCRDGLKQVSANHGGAGGNYMAIDSSVQWVKAPPPGAKLVVDPTVDPGGVWTRTNGYVHDSCLRRTDK
jgi:Tfp pilus assembly protein PilE